MCGVCIIENVEVSIPRKCISSLLKWCTDTIIILQCYKGMNMYYKTDHHVIVVVVVVVVVVAATVFGSWLVVG
jgi:hypothetical protein